jgi:RHS repeat-associated protein
MRDTDGNLIGWVDSSGNHWCYLLDVRGSVIALINDDGTNRANRYAYDDWGNQTFTCSACNGGTPLVQPWGYVSGYSDPTKLTKFGTRYYNPNTGTWTQADPVASQPDYQYVGGDPINSIDPSGTLGQSPCTGAQYQANINDVPTWCLEEQRWVDPMSANADSGLLALLPRLIY